MEQWKDIQGYEGKYQISDCGNVRRIREYAINSRVKSKTPERNLTPMYNRQGYVKVQLRKDNGFKNYFVHRLVASHFLNNDGDKKTVNHKNGIKDDNHLSNLEWCTQSENNYHKYRELGLKVNWAKKGAE